MNWLGKKVSKYIEKNDLVLDLGCGIMQATTGIYDKGKFPKCKTILGVELIPRYLDRVKYHYPTINTEVQNTHIFLPNSYDVVICLDVLEHLKISDAENLLDEMKRIARKYVIIYTPKEFEKNDENTGNAWDMGENDLQEHQCLMDVLTLDRHGFKTEIMKESGNVLGVCKI